MALHLAAPMMATTSPFLVATIAMRRWMTAAIALTAHLMTTVPTPPPFATTMRARHVMSAIIALTVWMARVEPVATDTLSMKAAVTARGCLRLRMSHTPRWTHGMRRTGFLHRYPVIVLCMETWTWTTTWCSTSPIMRRRIFSFPTADLDLTPE